MFGKAKGDMSDSERSGATAPQLHRAAGPSTALASAEGTASISSGMSIVGKITSDGTVKVFGRVEGELHAAAVIIADGAEIEGDIVAEELVVGGHVKGTVHANRVRLDGTAIVEGDIYHRSLAIEENARFEGSSRRKEAVNSQASQSPSPPSQSTALGVIRKGNGMPEVETQTDPPAG
jgi:cytoskeletal protein CcmA (bactofilin family)